MPEARWRRLELLFERAADLPPTARDELLTSECGDDRALRAELEALLASAPRAAAALHASVAAARDALSPTATAETRVGTRIGPYRLSSVLGEGGMGTVYGAERDDDAYRRKVAVKVLRHSLGSRDAVARFRDERQILATLDHPGIVRLLDGGTTDDGLPYLVLELVDGVRLDEHARGLPIASRVALVARIGAAVAYAHQRLVVHRDLKPGNVLVDRDGVPKLLDFGIAKLLDADGPREAQTRTGVALLTPEYASPEQVRGEVITVATDVYGLGALLYDLLVGRPPHRAGADALDTLHAICEVEPVRPSVAAPAARRELAGDLDNIVMKALQKQPAARYASVSALVDDLERSLDGRPVTARSASFGYRAGKLVRRHAGVLALATLIVAALATAAIVSMVQARRADEHARIAERETRAVLIVQARQELASGRASRALQYLAEVLRQGEDTPSLRVLVAEASRGFQLQVAETAVISEGALAAAWSPDGRTIAITGRNGITRLYDGDLRPRARLDVPDHQPRLRPAFTSDGRFVMAANDLDLRVWDVATGTLRHRLVPSVGRADRPRGWWVTPYAIPLVDGTIAAWVSPAGDVAVWDVETGVELVAIPAGTPRVQSAFASRDRRYLVLGRVDGSVIERDLTTGGERALAKHAADVDWVHRTTDGRILAWGDDAARIWGPSSLEPIAMLEGSSTPMHSYALDRAEATLAVGAGDGSVWIWDAHTGQQRAIAFAPAGVYGSRQVDLDATGTRMATAGGDAFRVWNASTAELQLVLEAPADAGTSGRANAGALGAWFSPDGARLLTLSGTEARLWRASVAPLEAELPVGHHVYTAVWSPDGSRVAVGGAGVAIHDLATGARTSLETIRELTYDVSWRPDGRALAVGGAVGALVFAADGTRLHVLRGHTAAVHSIRYRPDGARLLTAGDRTARIWDPADGRELRAFAHPASVMAATWNAAGTRIVTAGWDRVLRVWDAESGALLHTITSRNTQFLHAAFSPDEQLVASSGHDGEVAIWRIATGELVHTLEGHTGAATVVAWSPDGALLASSSEDGTARIWDPVTGVQLATRDHRSPLMQVAWSSDGGRILTAGYLGSARTWSVARDGRSVDEILRFAAAQSPWRLRGGRLVRDPGAPR